MTEQIGPGWLAAGDQDLASVDQCVDELVAELRDVLGPYYVGLGYDRLARVCAFMSDGVLEACVRDGVPSSRALVAMLAVAVERLAQK